MTTVCLVIINLHLQACILLFNTHFIQAEKNKTRIKVCPFVNIGGEIGIRSRGTTGNNSSLNSLIKPILTLLKYKLLYEFFYYIQTFDSRFMSSSHLKNYIKSIIRARSMPCILLFLIMPSNYNNLIFLSNRIIAHYA